VRGVVKALNHGTKDTIADPDAALALLKDRDPMMKLDIEKIRLGWRSISPRPSMSLNTG